MRLNIPDVQELARYLGRGAAVAKEHGRSEGEADYEKYVMEPCIGWLSRNVYIHEPGFRKIAQRAKDSMLEDRREEEIVKWLRGEST